MRDAEGNGELATNGKYSRECTFFKEKSGFFAIENAITMLSRFTAEKKRKNLLTKFIEKL